MEQVIQCLSAFLGCLGFAFVFRVHRHLPYALLGFSWWDARMDRLFTGDTLSK